MPEFWRHSGFHLLQRDAHGMLGVTDDYLRAYFARPEVAPVADSCAQERALFAALLEDPRRAVAPAEIDAMADADAAIAGGGFLVWADLLARSAVAPLQLPVGAVTALLGVPLLFFLLVRR